MATHELTPKSDHNHTRRAMLAGAAPFALAAVHSATAAGATPDDAELFRLIEEWRAAIRQNDYHTEEDIDLLFKRVLDLEFQLARYVARTPAGALAQIEVLQSDNRVYDGDDLPGDLVLANEARTMLLASIATALREMAHAKANLRRRRSAAQDCPTPNASR